MLVVTWPFARTARPAECPPVECRVRLADGATVRLRDATPADAARLRAMFYTLSEFTRYLYFCAGVPATDAFAAQVAKLGIADRPGTYAMVVEAGGMIVGVARFDRDAQTDFAEIGILLTDAWQSRGVGRVVVARLREAAGCRMLAGFTATVLGENRRAMRLLRGAFPNLRAAFSYGQYELTMPFAASAVAQSAAEKAGQYAV
jgi:RimJ/RimL family protein N-acetyltransferase